MEVPLIRTEITGEVHALAFYQIATAYERQNYLNSLDLAHRNTKDDLNEEIVPVKYLAVRSSTILIYH